LPAARPRPSGARHRADFVVDAALVSRLHCRVVAADERIDVEDLSSTNGTFINDRRISKGQLASGDRLRIGRVELTVERAPSA
jgi:pSer/pThr/pTyr-binding forkhead associated (FHA) protein